MSCKNYIKPHGQDLNTEISNYLVEVEEQENTETELCINCESFLKIVNPIAWEDIDYSLETND